MPFDSKGFYSASIVKIRGFLQCPKLDRDRWSFSEQSLAFAIELGALGFGRRLANLLDQRELDASAVISRDAIAEPVESLFDAIPKEALLSGYSEGAISETGEISDVPLSRLAVDPHVLDQDGAPVNVLLRRSLASVSKFPLAAYPLAPTSELGKPSFP